MDATAEDQARADVIRITRDFETALNLSDATRCDALDLLMGKLTLAVLHYRHIISDDDQ